MSFLFLVPFSLLPAFNHLLGEEKGGKGDVIVVIFFISLHYNFYNSYFLS